MRREFSAVREHCPPEKLFSTRHSPFTIRQSPFAIHQSLPFLARQEPRPPKISPIKVGAQMLRHQLRVKTRSMNDFGLRHQLWTEVRSMV